MDIKRILKLNIPDIHPTYRGVRGRTLSSRSQAYAWATIKEAGVKTIIDLRNDCVSLRMKHLCEQYGMAYFYYPVDNRTDVIENMIEHFHEFCERIDRGDFYIACAMGLHRTDIALCTYWVFYGADHAVNPPTLRGYIRATGHNTSKIMRVLNAFYEMSVAKHGKEPMCADEFKRRKKIINDQAKATDE